MTTSTGISLYREALFTSITFDWEKYDHFRPPYLKEFYDLIFDYHCAHEGSWDIAHDVGTGGEKSPRNSVDTLLLLSLAIQIRIISRLQKNVFWDLRQKFLKESIDLWRDARKKWLNGSCPEVWI